ncbi:MAG TPA: hypothetical protein VHO06_03865 [Polyangia bacterium]|nr:hypothetical protein [Polyangia bacterium]
MGDDASATFAASHDLGAAGYEVRTLRLDQTAASDPQIGRKLVRDPLELVVLDASRRPSEAMTLLEALRAADRSLPVVVIAGMAGETREEASRLGAEAVLDSPADVSRLRAAAEDLAPVLREFDREVEVRGYSFH